MAVLQWLTVNISWHIAGEFSTVSPRQTDQSLFDLEIFTYVYMYIYNVHVAAIGTQCGAHPMV